MGRAQRPTATTAELLSRLKDGLATRVLERDEEPEAEHLEMLQKVHKLETALANAVSVDEANRIALGS